MNSKVFAYRLQIYNIDQYIIFFLLFFLVDREIEDFRGFLHLL